MDKTLFVGQHTCNHTRRRQDGHHVGTPAHRWIPGHGRYAGPPLDAALWSVLRSSGSTHSPALACRPLSGALPQRWILGHGRCSGPLSVLRPLVDAPAHGRYSRPSLGCRDGVGAPAPCPCPAYGRYANPLPVSGPESVLTRMGGTHSPWSGPRQHNRGQAPSTTLDSAQQGTGADREKLTLFPAAHRWRSAPEVQRKTHPCHHSKMLDVYGTSRAQ